MSKLGYFVGGALAGVLGVFTVGTIAVVREAKYAQNEVDYENSNDDTSSDVRVQNTLDPFNMESTEEADSSSYREANKSDNVNEERHAEKNGANTSSILSGVFTGS